MPKKNANAVFRRHDLPRLELLRSFEAAARTLSFTRAADELALTQSAVSRQIQQIEDDLGVALFERGHRSLALTDAGRVLQRAVVDALERLRDATARLRAPQAERLVSITSTPGFASFWLIPRLASFTAAHPQVDVRVSATSDMLDLTRHRIDVAVRLVSSALGNGPALFEEYVEPVCAPMLVDHPEHPLRHPSDLQHHTLLTIDSPQEADISADWEPWSRIMGLPAPKMKNSLRFSSYADAIAAALAGYGVVIGRLPLIEGLLRDGKLVAPFGPVAASRRAYFVELAPHARHKPDAQDFVRWLRAQAASQLSETAPVGEQKNAPVSELTSTPIAAPLASASPARKRLPAPPPLPETPG